MPNHHKRHHLKPAEWLAFALLAVTGGALVITMIQNTPVLPHIKHIGCFKSDASFSQDKVLGFNAADSSTVGANLALAFEQAKSVWREGGGAVAIRSQPADLLDSPLHTVRSVEQALLCDCA
jgi:hypothetical protein